MKKTKEESSFSEEKEAKRLLYGGAGAFGCTEFRTKYTKVFCFFSSEKKTLPLNRLAAWACLGYQPALGPVDRAGVVKW